MYDGFVQRAHAVEKLLLDRRTTFLVVTTLEAAPLHEAEYFMDQLVRRDFHLGALVLNKALPDYLLAKDADQAAQKLCGDPAPIAAALAELPVDPLADAARTGRVLRTVGESFLNFEVVATREAELRSELSRAPEVTVRVPYFEVDIYDLSGLARIAEHLFARS